MPDSTFLPYRVASDSLEIRVKNISIDGAPAKLEEVVDTGACQMQLIGLSEWDSAELDVEVSDPNSEITGVIGPEESVPDTTDVFLALRGSKGRTRVGTRLAVGDQGHWNGKMLLRRSDHYGSLHLEAVAIRRSRGEPDIGLASWIGERIAWSKQWTVYIDDKPIMPGGAIVGEWRDFANDDSEELKRRSDCAWYLNLADPDKPKIYLNEGIDRLKGALEAPAVRGRPAAVRDVLAQSILQSVLVTLCVEAISGTDDTKVEDLDGWRKGLLVAMGKLADNSQSPELVVEGWLDAWRQDNSKDVLIGVGTAVQRHLRMPDAATRLVKATEA